jgi:hypothetical protein
VTKVTKQILDIGTGLLYRVTHSQQKGNIMATHKYRGYEIVKHDKGTAGTPLGRHISFHTTNGELSHPTLKGVKCMIDHVLDTPRAEREAHRDFIIALLQK